MHSGSGLVSWSVSCPASATVRLRSAGEMRYRGAGPPSCALVPDDRQVAEQRERIRDDHRPEAGGTRRHRPRQGWGSGRGSRRLGEMRWPLRRSRREARRFTNGSTAWTSPGSSRRWRTGCRIPRYPVRDFPNCFGQPSPVSRCGSDRVPSNGIGEDGEIGFPSSARACGLQWHEQALDRTGLLSVVCFDRRAGARRTF